MQQTSAAPTAKPLRSARSCRAAAAARRVSTKWTNRASWTPCPAAAAATACSRAPPGSTELPAPAQRLAFTRSCSHERPSRTSCPCAPTRPPSVLVALSCCGQPAAGAPAYCWDRLFPKPRLLLLLLLSPLLPPPLLLSPLPPPLLSLHQSGSHASCCRRLNPIRTLLYSMAAPQPAQQAFREAAAWWQQPAAPALRPPLT